MTAPNAVSLFRIATVPAVAALILADFPHHRFWAAAAFIVASLTDSLDGYLARSRDAVTVFGTFLDPLADKLLVSCTLIALVSLDRVSPWVAMVIVAREFAVTGLRLVAASREVISASWLGKWKTFMQLLAIGFLLAGEAGDRILPQTTLIGLTLLWISAILTLYTGFDYFRAGARHLVR